MLLTHVTVIKIADYNAINMFIPREPEWSENCLKWPGLRKRALSSLMKLMQ